MKITLLLDYPDDASLQFGCAMELHGGKVKAVQFSDLFHEHEVQGDALEKAVHILDRHFGSYHPDSPIARELEPIKAALNCWCPGE